MFACNQGGHFSQMMGLKELFGEYDSVLVTDNIHASKENPSLKEILAIEYAMSIANGRKKLNGKTEHLKNRLFVLLNYISLIWECIKIWKKYRPAVIISTGSNMAIGLFLYGRLCGSKLIYIESRAKVYSKTISGKIVEKAADRIFVQWPEMQQVYRKSEYIGTIV